MGSDEQAPGKLWAVGLGPGDSELVTFKAARAIERADVVAFHCARHGRSIALSVAQPYLRDGQIHERLVYPVTTETTDHPGGYRGALAEFYTAASDVLAAHLSAGRDVALLAEGDPLFYSSYMHMHKRLAGRFDTEIIPGVTSVSASAMAVGTPLVEGEETLTVLPGTLPTAELVRRLRDCDAAAIMKLGRNFAKVREALDAAGVADRAWYVERASTGAQKVAPVDEVDPARITRADARIVGEEIPIWIMPFAVFSHLQRRRPGDGQFQMRRRPQGLDDVVRGAVADDRDGPPLAPAVEGPVGGRPKAIAHGRCQINPMHSVRT